LLDGDGIAKLQVYESKFINCTGWSGGALVLTCFSCTTVGFNLYKSNSTFDNCSTIAYGGAVALNHAANATSTSLVSIEDSLFLNCACENRIITAPQMNLNNVEFLNCSWQYNSLIDVRTPSNWSCVSFVGCQPSSNVSGIIYFDGTLFKLHSINFVDSYSTLIRFGGPGTLSLDNWYANGLSRIQALNGGALAISNNRSIPVDCQASAPSLQPITTQPTLSYLAQQTTFDTNIVLNGLTLVLPSEFEGALITAPLVTLSGSLTIDLSYWLGEVTEIQLVDGAVEGSFDSIDVIGATCIAAEMNGKTIFFIDTCTSAAPALLCFC
jgi:hypothetical protein